jgi:hypothetical protein
MRVGRRWSRDAERADDVHLELGAQPVERERLERDGDRDAGVVHQPVKELDLLGGRGDRVRAGDVEQQLRRPGRRVAAFRTPA